MATLEDFEREFLPRAIASGGFGENVELIRVLKDDKEGADQFASSVLFVVVELKVNGSVERFSLVCKFQSDNEEIRKRFNTDLQFFNEHLFYQELLPFYQNLDLFPKYYFGSATLNGSHTDDIIIIEDLTPKGFTLTKKRLFVDADHVLMAFRKLGEFHGVSLALLHEDGQNLKPTVSKIHETRWLDSDKEMLGYFFAENAKRGVLPLLEDQKYSQVLTKFVAKLENMYGVIQEILELNELSVLCHGDFCRNNILFKYDDAGRPVDVKFFDPATVRYASPVVDISFFLFLNVSVEDRRSGVKNFLKEYLQGVQTTGGGRAPTEEQLWKEFQEKAVYGYLLAAFFLPVMVNNKPPPSEEIPFKERVARVLTYGGEEMTTTLTDMVKDLVSWGCLK